MAATKPEKISDVKKSDKITASPTSRPIIVTNHTMMTSDPMVVSSSDDAKTAPEMGRSTVPSRAEKVIKPVNDITLEAAPDTKKTEAPLDAVAQDGDAVEAVGLATSSAGDQTSTETPALTTEKPIPEVNKSDPSPAVEAAETVGTEPAEATLEMAAPEPVKPAAEAPVAEAVPAESEESPEPAEIKRDTAAAQASAEAEAVAAQSEREQEIAGLIASGKYKVPINAVQRKRSRIHVAVLSTFALLAALILLDAALDAGFVSFPMEVPHTHFFSQQ